jgi:hypothetical protein
MYLIVFYKENFKNLCISFVFHLRVATMVLENEDLLWAVTM